jgi:hypothetical protein
VPLPSWLRLCWLPQQLPFQPITDHENVGQQQGEGVLWVDFDQIGDWDELRRVFAEMKLPDFEFAMLGHLIVCVGPDVPGVEREDWYDADGARGLRGGARVRYLKAFALREAIAEAPIADRDLPRIYRREVFFLVSDRWIITRRRRGMSWTRGIPDDEPNSVDYDELMRTLEERWRNFNEPHDAATLMLRILADSWLPAITRIGARLQNSELAYVRGLNEPGGGGNLSDREYRQELVGLKWVVDRQSADFTGLLRPGVPVADKWFRVRHATDIAGEVDELLELGREEIRRHREQLRQSFDLIATTQTSHQIELSGEEQRRSRRLELVVALATAVLLVPALIATTFGAVPEVLANRGNLRLDLMLSLMGAAAVVLFVGLRLLQATGEEALDVADKRTRRAHVPVVAPVALALAVVFAAAALVGVGQAIDRLRRRVARARRVPRAPASNRAVVLATGAVAVRAGGAAPRSDREAHGAGPDRRRRDAADAASSVASVTGGRASLRTKALLVPGTRVRLLTEPVTDRVDQYGRLLRYVVRVRDGVNVNIRLVAVGAAAPYFYRHRRGRYANRLEFLAKRARARKLGLWRTCPRTPYKPLQGVATRR